jgi:4-O-beta-D-mannosyl-D-glucose phosphorylase
MIHPIFGQRYEALKAEWQSITTRANKPAGVGNGIFQRFQNPVLTAGHIPLHWRYDLDPVRNPYLLERIGVNTVFNAGAIKWENRYVMVARVEGSDRKSFFAVAESPNGIDQFRFWDLPVQMPETDVPDSNIYDMRLVRHEDGWIYGIFCTERRDPHALPDDFTSAVAQCGIARTHNLVHWERLPDLQTPSPQQRNVVLHPEFVENCYAFYTRPQDGFIETGAGGGIGFGLCSNITKPVIHSEKIILGRNYHTIYEAKNGLGPAPLKTNAGWLHLAHGVRNTAAGLRYVLFLFLTDLHDITRVTYLPGGYFMAPEGEEQIGDVSNVLFSNGWIMDDDGSVYIYYASSDTRMHVATSNIDILLDYVQNTPADGLKTAASVANILTLANRNLQLKGLPK